MNKRKLAAIGMAGIVGVMALTACGSQRTAQPADASQSAPAESPNREAGITTKDIRVTIVNEYPRGGGMFVRDKGDSRFTESSMNLGRGKSTHSEGDQPRIWVSVPGHRWDVFDAKNWPFQKPWFEYNLGDFDRGEEASLGIGESKEWTSPKTGISYTMSRQDDANGLIQMKLVIGK